jgi:hypothetical protein
VSMQVVEVATRCRIAGSVSYLYVLSVASEFESFRLNVNTCTYDVL